MGNTILIENVDKLERDSIRDPELYREIMEIEQELERESVARKARDRAKMFGLASDFDSMYRAVQRDFAKAQREEETANLQGIGGCMSNFPSRAALEQFRCGDWEAGRDGIFRRSEKGIQTACSHPIYPTRIMRNEETGKYKIELEFILRGRLRRVIVPRKMEVRLCGHTVQ